MKRFKNLLTAIGWSMLFFSALVPQSSMAADGSASPYEIVAIANQAFGNLIVSGKRQEAIRRIPDRARLYPFSAATNLCTAHIALGQFEEAISFCDEAIEVAERASMPRPRHWKARAEMATIAALAYSNRGVLRALSGDITGAEKDFQAAIEHKDNLRAPVQNYARLSVDSAESVAVVISSQ